MNEEIAEITKKFHDTYEKLSKDYDYETRKETRVFDINSSNGKLMYATVNEVIKPILEENTKLINQQKEFIEYMNKTIEELECDDVGDEELKGYLIQRISTFKEILSKFKEITGQVDGQVDGQV